MTTKPEVVRQHATESGVQHERFTRTNEVINEMLAYALNVKSYRAPFLLNIYKGNDPTTTGEPIVELPINKLDDGSFTWERNFRGKIEGHNYVTCVLKSEENLGHSITWKIDLDMPLDQIVRLNTDARAAAGR